MDNTEQIVNQKMQELNLAPIEKVADFVMKKKRFYAAPVISANQQKVFFKILIVDDPVPKESIRKEIQMRNLMMNFQDKITFSHLLNFNDKDLPYWFISQYYEGNVLGYLYDLYDESEEVIPLLIKTLSALHDITEVTLKTILKHNYFLKKDGFEHPLIILQSFENKLDEEIKTKIKFSKVLQFIKERTKYFQNHKVILAHGDYTLNNMVIKNNKMILNDWESGILGNIASDITHLWIQLWRYPFWRHKLLTDYIKTLPEEELNEFKRLFEAKAIFEALAEMIWNIKICPQKYKESQIEICIKTVNIALEGFDELAKL